MERKQVAFEITAIDGEGRTMEGYAATFGNVDLGGDIIHPGAFTKTLNERGPKVKFLWQHDPGEPLGKPVEIREDGRGLFVKAIISDTQRGRDALALLKDGAISEMSIGYEAVKGGTDYTKTGGSTVRNLREVKLYEFSIVSFPMNPQAEVTAIKSDEEMDTPKSEKAGRVLSMRNITRIQSAIEELQAALMEAGVSDPKDIEEAVTELVGEAVLGTDEEMMSGGKSTDEAEQQAGPRTAPTSAEIARAKLNIFEHELSILEV